MEAMTLERTEQSTQAPDELHHGAHIECQQGAPFVTLVCGIAADWYEKDDAGPAAGAGQCPTCHAARRCPLCGQKLARH